MIPKVISHNCFRKLHLDCGGRAVYKGELGPRSHNGIMTSCACECHTDPARLGLESRGELIPGAKCRLCGWTVHAVGNINHGEQPQLTITRCGRCHDLWWLAPTGTASASATQAGLGGTPIPSGSVPGQRDRWPRSSSPPKRKGASS